MKVITVMELKDGMELAEDIEMQGTIVFPAGTKIDRKTIDRIKRHGLMCVTIMEKSDYATTHYEKIQYDENFIKFCKEYHEALNIYKGIMISYLGTKRSIDSSVLMALYTRVSSLITTEGQLLDYLYNMMPGEDELTYTSSFNSALLCGAFADWLTLSDEEKKLLILCGFYYDIGKWNIPNDILWKPTKLTDEEFAMVKKHPVSGYAIVRNDTNLNEHIKNTVIMHHERYDGSGYPYHMKGEKIDKYARYLAIVDTYVAMASPRTFRAAFAPLQIIGTLESQMEKYDAQILVPLLSKIADTQIGTKLQLSDGSTWEVIMIQKNNFSRPMLKGNSGMILDLTTRPDLKIVKMV